ncbi:MAG TPA: class I SAM-dependent methyltransferase, partial [bacterium]|nr:class I SAM-dependent methyltransferase [bacterium]
MFQEDYWERKSLAKRRDPAHPVVRDYVVPKLDWVRPHLTLGPGARILDVGAGNGFFSAYLAGWGKVTAVDLSAQMLGMNPAPQKARMAAEHLAFADMAFDLVFCHALLHHVEDLDRVLAEMKRVSRRHVVVMEPNPANPLMALFSALVPEERKALAFGGDFLKAALERQDLRVTASCAFGLLVPNKTPGFLRPLLKVFNFPQPWGMTRILVAERR